MLDCLWELGPLEIKEGVFEGVFCSPIPTWQSLNICACNCCHHIIHCQWHCQADLKFLEQKKLQCQLELENPSSIKSVPHVQDDEKICESKNGLMRPCTLFIFASQMGRSPHLSTHLPSGSWGNRKELLRKREQELREMEMHIGYEERDTASLWTWIR